MPNQLFPIQYRCPFTAARLEEMYWSLRLPLHEIALIATTLSGWQKCPSDKVVRQWFIRAGVRMRTRSEANALTIERHRRNETGPFSENAKQAVTDAARRRWQPVLVQGRIIRPVNRGHKWTAAQRKRFSEIAKARHGAFRVERRCEYVLCLETFAVRGSHPDQRYCSNVCRIAASRKRIALHCAYCGKPIFRTPSTSQRGKSGLDYCNLSCGSAATSKGRKYPGRPKQDCTCGQVPHKSRCPVYKREYAARRRAAQED